jgi:hypothetical protein
MMPPQTVATELKPFRHGAPIQAGRFRCIDQDLSCRGHSQIRHGETVEPVWPTGTRAGCISFPLKREHACNPRESLQQGGIGGGETRLFRPPHNLPPATQANQSAGVQNRHVGGSNLGIPRRHCCRPLMPPQSQECHELARDPKSKPRFSTWQSSGGRSRRRSVASLAEYIKAVRAAVGSAGGERFNAL